ncbi:hypothetical protein [Nitrosophilus kaiyonis]|uniref:hypothetical protein n=1 Tax=Nitrosophilus kaiyonis TaxID=2930200 RepID=UPI0024907820|nr:hypothetical protein [Nitrosophilus kaiyonis]
MKDKKFSWEQPSKRNSRRKSFRPRCRYCKTNRYVIPIIYGYIVDEEILEKEKKQEIKIGGIARSIDAPNWFCKNCGNEFLR